MTTDCIVEMSECENSINNNPSSPAALSSGGDAVVAAAAIIDSVGVADGSLCGVRWCSHWKNLAALQHNIIFLNDT